MGGHAAATVITHPSWKSYTGNSHSHKGAVTRSGNNTHSVQYVFKTPWIWQLIIQLLCKKTLRYFITIIICIRRGKRTHTHTRSTSTFQMIPTVVSRFQRRLRIFSHPAFLCKREDREAHYSVILHDASFILCSVMFVQTRAVGLQFKWLAPSHRSPGPGLIPR